MKKLILLSAISSAALMAGGDIGSVKILDYKENIVVVEKPAPACEKCKVVIKEVVKEKKVYIKETPSKTDTVFTGNVNGFYETTDRWGTGDLFSKDDTALTVSTQLRADKSYENGVFIGGELTGTLSTDKLAADRSVIADGNWNEDASAAVTQAYAGYEFGNGSVTVGRQVIDKSTNPLVFSEEWNIVSNSFESATIDYELGTTDVSASFIRSANNINNLSKFNRVNGDKGLYTASVSDNTVDNLTLDAAYLYAPDANVAGDRHSLFVNSTYNASKLDGSVQAGMVAGDADADKTFAIGVKAEVPVTSNVTVTGAYSYVNDGTSGIKNAVGTRTPLYTQMLVNQAQISSDNQTVVVSGALEKDDCKVTLGYGYTKDESVAANDFQELDVSIGKRISNDLDIVGTYAYVDQENLNDGENIVRVVADYRF